MQTHQLAQSLYWNWKVNVHALCLKRKILQRKVSIINLLKLISQRKDNKILGTEIQLTNLFTIQCKGSIPEHSLMFFSCINMLISQIKVQSFKTQEVRNLKQSSSVGQSCQRNDRQELCDHNWGLEFFCGVYYACVKNGEGSLSLG